MNGDPLDGVLTGPVIFAGPAIVATRPLDPRQGNEWSDLGTVTSMKVTVDPERDRPFVPVVSVPYDELLFLDERGD